MSHKKMYFATLDDNKSQGEKIGLGDDRTE